MTVTPVSEGRDAGIAPTRIDRPAAPTRVTFGSAHLLVDGMSPDTARALLEAALEAGVTRLDTAPLYGHGGAEALVAALASAHPGIAVTTKVGLEPSPPPAPWKAAAGRLLRRLPPTAVDGVRRLLGRDGAGGDAQAAGPSGRFGLADVRRSVERSLTRLGRIDRLLLHEVHPADITDELLTLLADWRRSGDIASFGVATGNAVTAAALRRSHGLFTVAHVSVDPLGVPAPAAAEWPTVHWVGHGALGAGARTLHVAQRHLREDASLATRWANAVRGTPFAGESGLGEALLARAAAGGGQELLVATRRVERVGSTVRAASGRTALPPAALAALHAALSSPPGAATASRH